MEFFWQNRDFLHFQFKVDDLIGHIQEIAIELVKVNGLYINVSEDPKIENSF